MKQASRILRSIAALIFIVSTCLQGIQPAAAQEGGGERIGHNRNTGKVSFVGAPTGHPIRVASAQAPNMAPRDRALAMLQPYAADFGLADAGRDLSVKAARSERGRDVTRFQQTHRGIPVMGGEIVVNADDRGGLLSINGEISPDLDIDVAPRVTAELAQLAAIQAMAKVHGGAPSDYSASEPELWIYDSRLLQPDGTQPGLVWRMNVGATDAGVPINELVLIDAARGYVRLNFNQIDASWTAKGRTQRANDPSAAFDKRDELGPVGASLLPPDVVPPAPLGTGTGDRYVNTTGTNTGECLSPSSPCLTINYALGQANANETVFVGIGTYTSTWTVVTITKNIQLSGGWDPAFAAQVGASVIDGQGVHTGIQLNNTVVSAAVERFSIQNATPYGIISYGGTVVVNNSTVSRGGVGVVVSSGLLTLNHSTVVFNHAGIGGHVHLRNSIVYHNTSGGSAADCPNYHVDAITSVVGAGCTVNWAANLIGVDPEVSAYPVGNAGYHALSSTSPAIDAGTPATCLLVDQRGMMRPQGPVCDVGAYEYVAPGLEASLWIADGSGQRAGMGFWFERPLVVYALDAQGSPVPGVSIVFSAPESGPSGTFEGGWNTSATVLTDAEGRATSPLLRPNELAGGFVLTASAGPLTAEFQLENVTSTTMEIASGSPQTTRVNKPFASPLQVLVRDELGSPLPGVTVNFLAPGSGPSIRFSDTGSNALSVVTDGSGVASSGGTTANSLAGAYSVQVTAEGMATSVSFSLTNVFPDVRTYTRWNSTGSLPGTFRCDLSYVNCTNGTDPHADAAQANAYRSYDFYRTRLNRDSINNSGMAIVSTVHYGSLFDNAYWDSDLLQMVYGDNGAWPLADDVVAHELTHGVTQYESNLFYYYQSGAISESLSDVFGEVFDQTNGVGTDTPAVKWLVGEDVTGSTPATYNGPFRSMSNPPAYGGMPASIDPDHPTSGDPDRINTSRYYIGPYDNGGVHLNSGVNNKAAYLLADGGSFNGMTVAALGIDKTLAIYYEAQTDLLTSGADYGDLYYVLQQACVNLIGSALNITTADCLEVKDAVDAVAMYAQPSSDTGFNTEAPLCSAGNRPSDLFYDNMESISTANWTTGSHWTGYLPDDARAHSGLYYLYADDLPDVLTDGSATMKASVTLPANAHLHFAHAYDFEYYNGDPNRYDGGVLEYSTDNGSTWNDIGARLDFNAYDHTIYTYPPGDEIYNNPLHGRMAFTGTSHGYISSHANLGNLAGQSVRFRWRMGLDAFGYNWGWWLDDVRIYTCELPQNGVISGEVGVPGATMYYFDNGPQSVTSYADGRYSISVPWGWSGTVTPYKQNYTFAPPSMSYTNVLNESDRDYVATLVTHDLIYTPAQHGSIAGIHPQTVVHGSNGTAVTAVPEPGYHFLKWSDNSEANPRTDLNVIADKSLTASFIINSGARTDFDGDNRTDPAKFVPVTGKTWWIRSSDGAWASANLGTDTTSYVPRSDFNGDGKADPAKFLSSGALYYIESSTGTWGGLYVGSDYNTAASGSDFDGDGRTDPAKYLPEGAVWYYKSSTASWQGEFIGPDAVPYLPASDYDGDGKTDMAKYISIGAIWYLKSSTGTWDGAYIGSDGTPIAGSDFDGDGKTDVAKFLSGSNSVWYQKSSTGTWEGVYMGPGAFQYITASDFDGDGKTDPAKFDAAGKVLWWIKSTTGQWDGAWLGAEDFQTVN